MNKASKYGKKVPSYSQPDPWHLGENGSFFFPKGGSSSKGSLFPGGVSVHVQRKGSHPQTLDSSFPLNQNHLHWESLLGQERASVRRTMLPPSGARSRALDP